MKHNMCNATIEPCMVLEDRRQGRRQRCNFKDCRVDMNCQSNAAAEQHASSQTKQDWIT